MKDSTKYVMNTLINRNQAISGQEYSDEQIEKYMDIAATIDEILRRSQENQETWDKQSEKTEYKQLNAIFMYMQFLITSTLSGTFPAMGMLSAAAQLLTLAYILGFEASDSEYNTPDFDISFLDFNFLDKDNNNV